MRGVTLGSGDENKVEVTYVLSVILDYLSLLHVLPIMVVTVNRVKCSIIEFEIHIADNNKKQ